MTTPTTDDPLLQYTDDALARPIPDSLRAARAEVLAVVAELRTIGDNGLDKPWAWKGGSETEIRYGVYRIHELFERAGIDADVAIRQAGLDRGRAADIVAPVTAARWELHGSLLPLEDAAWDGDPGGGEWTIRQTLGHVILGQRGYGAVNAWWQAQALPGNDPGLPLAPESIFDVLPTEEVEAEGSPATVRDRLDDVVDRSTERLAGLPADRLANGARWSGFPVDVGFRMGRWSSHIREHTIQVEKTLDLLGHRSTEGDRLVRLVLAAWGRAEAVVYGHADQRVEEAIGVLATAAADARGVAAEIARLSRG